MSNRKKKVIGKKQGFLKNGMAYQWSVDLTTPSNHIGGSFEASYVGSRGLDLWHAKYPDDASYSSFERFEIESIDQLVAQLLLYKEALIKADVAFSIALAKEEVAEFQRDEEFTK